MQGTRNKQEKKNTSEIQRHSFGKTHSISCGKYKEKDDENANREEISFLSICPLDIAKMISFYLFHYLEELLYQTWFSLGLIMPQSPLAL